MDNKSFTYKGVYTTLRQCTVVSKDTQNHLGVKHEYEKKKMGQIHTTSFKHS